MFGFEKWGSKQKVEGDSVRAGAFAKRLRELEPGAAQMDVEMAANALALKYKEESPSDEEVRDMYKERIAARPDTPEDKAKIEATLDRH